MTIRERIADWLTSGEFTKAKLDAMRAWESKTGTELRAYVAYVKIEGAESLEDAKQIAREKLMGAL